MTDGPPIRDAATVILVHRNLGREPHILMGQRGAKAAFMPSKFVFPGGAVDASDTNVPLAGWPDPLCTSRLSEGVDKGLTRGLLAAAIRETWEETGLIFGKPGTWDSAPKDWISFARQGLLPDASALSFVFRAITPPGRPRRFDARFFLADADKVQGDVEHFSGASDELSNLQWIPLSEVRSFDLPFITQVVLAEVSALIRDGRDRPESVPFFHNDDEETEFRRLGLVDRGAL